MKKTILILTCIMLIASAPAFSHCQIPCGVYDDELRIKQIEEDIFTIEKSMNAIIELSQKSDKDYNQLVRWIDNKEKHAQYIQDIVSEYFLAQRIKPIDKKDAKAYTEYTEQLRLLHHIIVYAMKAKQGTDLNVVSGLRLAVSNFKKAYFKK